MNPTIANPSIEQKPRLLDKVRNILRTIHHNMKTVEAYLINLRI
jgi:hypothetical protein